MYSHMCVCNCAYYTLHYHIISYCISLHFYIHLFIDFTFTRRIPAKFTMHKEFVVIVIYMFYSCLYLCDCVYICFFCLCVCILKFMIFMLMFIFVFMFIAILMFMFVKQHFYYYSYRYQLLISVFSYIISNMYINNHININNNLDICTHIHMRLKSYQY